MFMCISLTAQYPFSILYPSRLRKTEMDSLEERLDVAAVFSLFLISFFSSFFFSSQITGCFHSDTANRYFEGLV